MWVPVDVWGGVRAGDATAGRAQLNSPAGEGAGARGSGCGASVWVPELGRSPQFKLSMVYAGDTWLEETEETSVLLWDAVEEVSSSPNGFLPQQIVVIMQLRNWGGREMRMVAPGGPVGTRCRTKSPWMG